MPKFIKLRDQVDKALTARRPARPKRLTYEFLLRDNCPHISSRAIASMDQVKLLLLQKLEESGQDEESSDDEKMCAVFAWVCNVVEVRFFCPRGSLQR